MKYVEARSEVLLYWWEQIPRNKTLIMHDHFILIKKIDYKSYQLPNST